MNHEWLEGSAVHSIAVIEHPALLVGVAKVFEPTNLRLLLGAVPSEECEKLGLVVKINGGETEFRAALPDDLEVVGLILGGSTHITGAEDEPYDLVPGLQILFQFVGTG